MNKQGSHPQKDKKSLKQICQTNYTPGLTRKDKFEALECIDHKCHNTPGYSTPGKLIIKI